MSRWAVCEAPTTQGRGSVNAPQPRESPAFRRGEEVKPWWSLCSAIVASKLADEPVTCRNCLRALDRHGLKIGEVAHE